ncbi:MAG TPA: class I SAM-dependent methyltransferase [Candidatus Binataceae bacterium]
MPEYSKFARYYDAAYSFKKYQAEAERLHAIISSFKLSPGNTLLDVACGTGGHLAFLRRHYSVEGLDLSEPMLEIARQRYPEIVFHQADMVKFDLARQFDAITCLFSAIGYVKTVKHLGMAVNSMARHLKPGGVLIVEPWFTNETGKSGGPHSLFVDTPDLKLARMNITTVRNGRSIIKFHYLAGTPERIDHFTERHELALFAHQEYLDAFSSAGLEVSHDAQGLIGRGLYIGTSAI